MLCRMFQAHGEMCVSHPWEVILAGISAIACLMSMSLFASVDKISSSIHSSAMEEPGSSDLIIITFTRCVAVLYIYLQFRNLRKLGSNYLLGIAVAFSTLSIFVFSIMVLSIMGSNLSGIWEALPFFVLLMDLSRVITLGRSALSSTSPSQVSNNIASSMALLGPTVTLDAIVQTLVIGIGTLSGVEKLEMICGFGCLSVIANYVAFMTFYPACLILVLQLSIGQQKEPAEWQITEKREDEQLDKPNPVTLRVKIIMSAGLVLVHAHSRWVTAMAEKMAALEPHSADHTGYISPDMPLWQVYLTKTFASSVDYSITLALAVILAAKYKFFDYEVDIESTVTVKRPVAPLVTRTSESGTLTNLVETPCHTAQATDMSEGCLASKPSFIIGDGESEHSEESRTDAKEMVSVDTQTDPLECGEGDSRECTAEPQPPRSLEECVHIMKTGAGAGVLTDKEVLLLLENRELKGFQLESALGDKQRAVNVRRKLVSNKTHSSAIYNLPHKNYDYEYVHGACCENVIGYMPIPVGITGPLLLDGKKYMVPMATTEGTLVASTNRGCSAITASGGVKTMVNTNGMTRAPVVRFPSAQRAHTAKLWLEDQHNFDLMVLAFNSTSRYGRLQKLHVVQAARSLYIRFVAYTGDAMGMNMVSKGSEKVLQLMRDKYFEDMEILSLSGNFCSDKKPSAVNWLEGRGKSVVCDAVIPGNIVKSTLKTSVPALVDLYINKNLVGSAMAGSIGGFNAHAANIVAAIFIATGQDPAQVVCSSYCLTVMEPAGVDGEDLYISCTMPSLEVGTVGGGTVLPPQAACLEMLGVRGSSKKEPGANALQLARVICGTVLAGELSLMSALAAGHLVRSHLKHNRSSINMAPVSDEPKAEGSIVLPSISKKMRDKGKDLAACVHGVS